MHLDFSENQQALDDLIGKLCQDLSTPDHVRKAEQENTLCSELWEHMIESGVAGLIIPESYGGTGFSILDAVPAYEQMGRHLAATPHFASSVVSALVLQCLPQSAEARECLKRIAAGEAIVSPAWLEPHSGFLLQDIETVASITSNGYRLNGRKVHVPFAQIADQFLVIARIEGHSTAAHIFLVDADNPGLRIEETSNLVDDGQGRLIFEDAQIGSSAYLSGDLDTKALWSESLNQAVLLDAAYAAGLAERALEITVDYAKEREQFGNPIGAFQAISHPLVDSKVAVNGAKTLVYEAAWAHSEGLSYRALASMAALFAKDTARIVTARAEQIHGGIGFTLEYDIQLYYRRAKQLQTNWYDKRSLESKIAESILDDGEAWSGPDPFAPKGDTITALSRSSNRE